jgi:IS1 transposase
VLQHANPTLLPSRCSRAVRVPAGCAAELDEMWSFVGAKEKARWLWHALDHHSGRVLASVVGSRKDVVFLELQAWSSPARTTLDWEIVDAKERAQAPHSADASETLDLQDALFFPLARPARPPHRVIHKPC